MPSASNSGSSSEDNSLELDFLPWLARMTLMLGGFWLKNSVLVVQAQASSFLVGNFFVLGLQPPSKMKNLFPSRSPRTRDTTLLDQLSTIRYLEPIWPVLGKALRRDLPDTSWKSSKQSPSLLFLFLSMTQPMKAPLKGVAIVYRSLSCKQLRISAYFYSVSGPKHPLGRC